MQNLHKLFILTTAFLCANYFSTLAQGEQKAFNEGDKVMSFGLSGGSGSSGYSRVTPSISFDYGLKGTRGIVSIGGFLSYTNSTSRYTPFGTGNFIITPPLDSNTYYQSYTSINKQSITAGLRLGLHYSTRKWDLYAGAMIGYQFNLAENHQLITDTYTKNPNAKFPITSTSTIGYRTESSSPNSMVLSPYVGARYYVTKKISLNLEMGQHTGNAGIGFKF